MIMTKGGILRLMVQGIVQQTMLQRGHPQTKALPVVALGGRAHACKRQGLRRQAATENAAMQFHVAINIGMEQRH